MRRGATRRRRSARTTESSPDWYLDFAFDEVKALANAGKLGADRVLTVRTGLDTGLQAKTDAVLEDMLRVNAPAYNAHQAAAVVADTDGLVRAMFGGRDYGASQFNRATDAARQPGSSFKIFDYMTALLTGKYHKDTTVQAGGICIGDYCVHNFGGESGGAMPLYQALAQSYNTAAIWISVKIGEVYWPAGKPYHLAKIAALGRSKIVETARKMGLTTPLVDTVSLPVGADEVKMIDMVGANAMLANGGKRATPYAAIEIRNSAGKVIYTHAANGTPPVQVLPPDKVAEMNNIMTHVLTEGTGRGAQIPGLVIAGKTGTTNGPTNAWFNAFTGNLVGSVWFGNDDNSSMTGNMPGGALPAQTWREIMAYAHQGLEAKPPYGVPPVANAQIAAAPSAKGGAGIAEAPRQIGLSPKSARIILEIGDFARSAEKHGAIAPAERYAADAEGDLADHSRRRAPRLSVALDFAGRAADFPARLVSRSSPGRRGIPDVTMVVKAIAAGAIGLALGVAASGSILADPPFGGVTIGAVARRRQGGLARSRPLHPRRAGAQRRDSAGARRRAEARRARSTAPGDRSTAAAPIASGRARRRRATGR